MGIQSTVWQTLLEVDNRRLTSTQLRSSTTTSSPQLFSMNWWLPATGPAINRGPVPMTQTGRMNWDFRTHLELQGGQRFTLMISRGKPISTGMETIEETRSLPRTWLKIT